MSEDFAQRVATYEGFQKELRVIEMKVFIGVLSRPEDSYMWPYIEDAVRRAEGTGAS